MVDAGKPTRQSFTNQSFSKRQAQDDQAALFMDNKNINLTADSQPVAKPEDEGDKPGLFSRLWNTFDHSVLFCLGMQYFNTGMRTMVMLGVQNLFQEKYGL